MIHQKQLIGAQRSSLMQISNDNNIMREFWEAQCDLDVGMKYNIFE